MEGKSTLLISVLSLCLLTAAPGVADTAAGGSGGGSSAGGSGGGSGGGSAGSAGGGNAPAKTDKTSDSKDSSLDDLKAGKFLKYGLTGGVGVVWHVPTGGDNAVTGGGVSAMPYVAAFPRYWWQAEITRNYCASSMNGDDAQLTANDLAVKRTVDALAYQDAKCVIDKLKQFDLVTLDDKESVLRDSTSSAGAVHSAVYRACQLHLIKKTPAAEPLKYYLFTREPVRSSIGAESLLSPGDEHTSLDEVARFLASNELTTDAFQKLPAGARYLLVAAMTGWDLTEKGRCGLNKVGVSLGVPLKFDTNVNLNGSALSTTVQPLIAVGLVFQPISYAGITAGVEFMNAKMADTKDASGTTVTGLNKLVVGPYIGISGSIDFVSLLLPGK